MSNKFYFAACAAGQVCLNSLPNPTNTTNPQPIIELVIGIMAAITFLMITIGGFNYITSEGDPQKASRAKNTILYALIGLVIVMFAQAIVSFVAGKV